MSGVSDAIPVGVHLTRGWVTLTLSFLLVSPASAEERILLRGGAVRAGAKVTFNEDGVKLGDQWIGWDEISSAILTSEQARFDKMLKELGDPLFRIRGRLEKEDYSGIEQYARPLVPIYAKRRSATAYMVLQGLLRSRLENGQPEQALEAHLLCLECFRELTKSLQRPRPAWREVQIDPRTGFAKDLLPIWFDAKAAKEAWPGVRKAMDALEKPIPPGVYLYAATLALAAGEAVAADELLKQTPKDEKVVNEMLRVIAAQREVEARESGQAVEALAKTIDQFSSPSKPLAHYWLGLGLIQSKDVQKKKAGVLQLLHVPALYASDSRELSAAALYHAVKALESLQDPRSGDLGEELFRTYPNSLHAAKRKVEIQVKLKDTP
jgi:hypothetical protein